MFEEHRKTIEEEYDVEVLEARDFGSRAWSVNHSDSDYDVGIIFLQKPNAYYTLQNYRETIDRQFDDGLVDVMGWNLKHFLMHCYQDKPSAFEFLRSREVYYSDIDLSSIEEYVCSEFNRVSAYHHYRKLAKNQYKRYLEDRSKPTVKRNLYVFRGLLYAQWIQHEQNYPNLNLKQFSKRTRKKNWSDDGIIDSFQEILRKKQMQKGKEKVGVLNEDWVKERISKVDIDTTGASSLDKKKLDEFIIETMENR